MKKVMLGDRLLKRAKATDFMVIGGTTKAYKSREENWDKNLLLAYEKGKTLFNQVKKKLCLEDRFFTTLENSESGEVSGQTIFCYHQKNNVIWAEYAGGKIVKGFLVGTIDEKNNLHFSYQHLNTENELKSGMCDSVPEIIENGKIRFHEKWQWTNGISGESVVQEL